MQQVSYFAPQNLQEALAYYAEFPDVRLVAGATDVLVALEYGKYDVTQILDLKKLEKELNYIKEENGCIHVGALTTIDQMEKSPLIQANFPFLAYAASVLGSWQVRCLATAGGNICNGAPSAETTPSYLVVNAKVVVAGAAGERTMDIKDFLVGPGKVALQKGELLKEFILPVEADLECCYACRKLRRSMDVALVNLACAVKRDAAGVITDARVALGAVAPVCFRAADVEAYLVGKKLDDEVIAAAAEMAAAAAKPITDIRATADYRRRMVKVYTGLALKAIKDGVKGGIQA